MPKAGLFRGRAGLDLDRDDMPPGPDEVVGLAHQAMDV